MDSEVNKDTLVKEVFKVSSSLCDVKDQIKSQRLEIGKYESLMKPYQEYITKLNGSLDRLNELKLIYKRQKDLLLNKISRNSDSESELPVDITNIKTDPYASIENNPIESANCSNNSFTENTDSLINVDGIKQDTNDLDESQINNIGLLPKIEKSLDTSQKIRNRVSFAESVKNEDDIILTGNESEYFKKSEIPRVLEFKTCMLTCVLQCSAGILIGGSKGTLQLRDCVTYDVIQRYVGFKGRTVIKILVIPQTFHTLIISCSRFRLLVFVMETGVALKLEDFPSEITGLNWVCGSLMLCFKSGNISIFDSIMSRPIEYTLNGDSFVRSAISLGDWRKEPSIMMVCHDGSVYVLGRFQDRIRKERFRMAKNCLGLLWLPTGRFLAYNSKKITILCIKTLLVSKMRLHIPIKKIFVFRDNLYILSEGGIVQMYPIIKSNVDFTLCQTFNTHDLTLKDIHITPDKGYLIGDANVFCWEYNS